MTSNPLDIVRQLSEIKKNQKQWSELSVVDRQNKILKNLQLLQDDQEFLSKYQLMAAQAANPLDSVWCAKQRAKLLSGNFIEDDYRIHACGLMAVVPWKNAAPIVWSLERILPGLLAGNSVIWVVPTWDQKCAEALKNIFDQIEILKDQIHIFYDDKHDLADFLSSHPSVAIFCGFASGAESELWMNQASRTHKKIHIQVMPKNAICFLNPITNFEDFKKQMSCLCQGGGVHPWSAQTIYVLESHLEVFLDHLKKWIESDDIISEWNQIIHEFKNRNSNFDQNFLRLKNQVAQDQGRLIVSDSKLRESALDVLWVRDMSHCSVLQQESVDVPLFIISTVKYQYEIPKWIQANPLCQWVLIWGDTDKSMKLARSLSCPQIQINQQIPDLWKQDIRPGSHRIFFGDSDLSWKGSLFSNHSQIYQKS